MNRRHLLVTLGIGSPAVLALIALAAFRPAAPLPSSASRPPAAVAPAPTPAAPEATPEAEPATSGEIGAATAAPKPKKEKEERAHTKEEYKAKFMNPKTSDVDRLRAFNRIMGQTAKLDADARMAARSFLANCSDEGIRADFCRSLSREIHPDNLRTFSERLTLDSSPAVRGRLIDCVADYWKEPSVREQLELVARTDTSSSVRKSAEVTLERLRRAPMAK